MTRIRGQETNQSSPTIPFPQIQSQLSETDFYTKYSPEESQGRGSGDPDFFTDEVLATREKERQTARAGASPSRSSACDVNDSRGPRRIGYNNVRPQNSEGLTA
ncbi:hypothetical protein MLD38_015744 [Melastoma candidum]|uniref:Uncharacterized protein n=1 Tax=Melastoma candidum TaxID=119954 RepID=A0ACB9RH66_9MYRT|nr:hypothetical protein MLD38_015744 [Melastoma candidum]